MPPELKTASEVIDALGGTAHTARLVGTKDQHVSNWRATGRIAASTFLIIQQELVARGRTADPAIWGIRRPKGGQ